jgi:transcriptional regulator with XRE-family HTH domain
MTLLKSVQDEIKSKNLTQKDLAKKLGTTQPRVSEFMNAKSIRGLKMIERIFKVFKLRVTK